MRTASPITEIPLVSAVQRVLDTSTVQARLVDLLSSGRWGGGSLVSLYVTRAFPRRDGSLTVQYELNFNRAPSPSQSARLLLCGQLMPSGDSVPDWAKGVSENIIVFEDLHFYVPIFPHDPNLRLLATLTDPVTAGSFITAAVTEAGISSHATTSMTAEVLAYRLGRRCVMRHRWRTSGENSTITEVITKAMKPSAAAGLIARNSWLRENRIGGAGSPADVVSILWSDARSGIVIMKSAQGIPIHDLIGLDKLKSGYYSAGMALRELHALPAFGPTRHTPADELDQLRSLVPWIGCVQPTQLPEFQNVVDCLDSSQPTGEIPAVCIHNDFYDKQVLWSSAGVTLLDCDSISGGDPAQDYGNFLAHATLRSLQSPGDKGNIKGALESFRSAYSVDDADFASRTQWWRAASLCRLSVLYALRPRWASISSLLLSSALEYISKWRVNT
jgi:hypothetical protein